MRDDKATVWLFLGVAFYVVGVTMVDRIRGQEPNANQQQAPVPLIVHGVIVQPDQEVETYLIQIIEGEPRAQVVLTFPSAEFAREVTGREPFDLNLKTLVGSRVRMTIESDFGPQDPTGGTESVH